MTVNNKRIVLCCEYYLTIYIEKGATVNVVYNKNKLEACFHAELLGCDIRVVRQVRLRYGCSNSIKKVTAV